MNYITKPTNRKEIRSLACWFRLICGFNEYERINPIELLDKIQDIDFFSNLNYEVLYNNELEKNVPSQCNYDGFVFTIQLKESTYQKAYKNMNGGCRMHIMHEIAHIFLYKIGFIPLSKDEIPKNPPIYMDIEWISKALAGEIMMPYDFTINLSVQEIMGKYGVSKDAAEKRKQYK